MRKGLSLIEVLLYLGLVALIMPLIASIVFFSADTRVRGQDMNVLTAEGERVVQVISGAIRGAESVNQPAWGDSGLVLSLMMADSEKNPTVFRLNNGVVTIQEGAGSEVALTSGQVAATDLLFFNRSQIGTPGSVRAEFNLANSYLTKKFYVSGSLR